MRRQHGVGDRPTRSAISAVESEASSCKTARIRRSALSRLSATLRKEFSCLVIAVERNLEILPEWREESNKFAVRKGIIVLLSTKHENHGLASMRLAETRIDRTIRLQELSQYSRTLAEFYLARARATIRDIVADPHLLDSVALKREGGRYTRTLLFGDNQMSAWAILWPAGSQTCVHDHHCSCCFGVARGSLKEIWYRAVGPREVVVDRIARRGPGYVAAMLPSGPNIHQMINDGPGEALSVHIYGFDHTLHASSIDREYNVVAQ